MVVKKIYFRFLPRAVVVGTVVVVTVVVVVGKVVVTPAILIKKFIQSNKGDGLIAIPAHDGLQSFGHISFTESPAQSSMFKP